MGKLRQGRGSDSPELTQQEKRISITSQQLVQSPVLQAALPLVPQVPRSPRGIGGDSPDGNPQCARPPQGGTCGQAAPPLQLCATDCSNSRVRFPRGSEADAVGVSASTRPPAAMRSAADPNHRPGRHASGAAELSRLRCGEDNAGSPL